MSEEDKTPEKEVQKKPYEPPTMTDLGDFRGVTLGGSPGGGESGGGAFVRRP